MRRMETQSAQGRAGRTFESSARTRAVDEYGVASTFVPLAWALLAGIIVSFLTAFLLVTPASAEPPVASLAPEPVAEPVLIQPDPRDLQRLLSVPSTHALRNDSRTTDEEIAAAVRLGNGDRFVRPSGFRKRNIDLFRSEHPVEIANQEMLLRLRLRAKKRETMSVELRF